MTAVPTLHVPDEPTARAAAWLDAVLEGDDLTDVVIMRRVGLSIAVANARPEVKKCAMYTTEAAGGYGAVREVIEIILKAQGHWDDLLRVTGGQTDEGLARMTIRASSGVFGWMKQAGVRFQPHQLAMTEHAVHEKGNCEYPDGGNDVRPPARRLKPIRRDRERWDLRQRAHTQHEQEHSR